MCGGLLLLHAASSQLILGSHVIFWYVRRQLFRKMSINIHLFPAAGTRGEAILAEICFSRKNSLKMAGKPTKLSFHPLFIVRNGKSTRWISSVYEANVWAGNSELWEEVTNLLWSLFEHFRKVWLQAEAWRSKMLFTSAKRASLVITTSWWECVLH